jgi:hypothetical protein
MHWGEGMRHPNIAAITAFVAILIVPAAAYAQTPSYTWALPKTVIDISLTYEYADCVVVDGTRQFRIKVTPIIAARGVADVSAGMRTQNTGDLIDGWQDRNMTITTFAGSHIVSGVTAHPVSQAATVAGNVLTGIAKLASIAIGAGFLAHHEGPPVVTKCADDEANPGHFITAIKNDIATAQKALAGKDVSDDLKKKLTDQIAALQTLLTQQQAKMAFTVKATIDPGFTNPKATPVGLDAAPPLPFPDALPDNSPKLGAIPKDGLIATLAPKGDQLPDAPWVTAEVRSQSEALLEVTVFMDMAHALKASDWKIEKSYYLPTPTTGTADSLTYRDPAYIAVLVYLGQGGKRQLLSNNRLPFAQYGDVQVVPFKAKTFRDVLWSISFSETGETTNSSFTSKSYYANATNLLNTAATAAGTVVNAVTSESATKATAMQTKADEIYQENRLRLCQADATTCPSK